ncbi:VC0807 family protein [Beggiatoa leptomitoformis]|uniref:MFS transporter n=1 Tax=Beggiatoa leptomitoformis TaxID=288004 RepID=A0A2N9YIR8_9GAMM|nr:VC0807 family protein [Beggiatoa leptomitoformis]ALG67393.1 MFS transporter [Beggiatoa leptomitoformis]AUI70397.1 MFS transporter [Beggiatoa leptomitoformis]
MTTQNPERENVFVSLLINIVIPSVILMKFTSDAYLGTVYGLLVALTFPLIYGLWDLVIHKKFNIVSILGLVSILLTGGIGLLELDPEWIAIKEASIPLMIGLAVLISLKTPYPLVKTFIYNEKIINVEKVEQALQQQGTQAIFEKRLVYSTYFVASSFLLSAILNYGLAKMVVTSPSGTVAFNEELGKMMALSYPVIAIPSMVVLMFALWFLVSGIKKLTHLPWEDIFQMK